MGRKSHTWAPLSGERHRSLREEEIKIHLEGRSGAVSSFHADLVPVSKLSQKNCRTELCKNLTISTN
jgi:hypothetical protein